MAEPHVAVVMPFPDRARCSCCHGYHPLGWWPRDQELTLSGWPYIELAGGSRLYSPQITNKDRKQ